MLRAVLIDGFDSTELVEVVSAFVNAKGKPLAVSVLPHDADLTRAQTHSASKECLVVVHQAERARAAERVKGLEVMQVDDEAELPLLIAARVGGSANRGLALAFYLRKRHGIEASVAADGCEFRGVAWRAITGDELGELSGVMAPVPVQGSVTLRADGGVASVSGVEPSQAHIAEARSFAASLVHHGQVHIHTPGQRIRGSHEVVTDADGRRRLVRVSAGARSR